MQISAGSRNSVYPAILQNDNHWSNRIPRFRLRCPTGLPQLTRKKPGSLAVDDQNNRCMGFWEIRAPGTICAGLGNEGVGEHVRTRFHVGL